MFLKCRYRTCHQEIFNFTQIRKKIVTKNTWQFNFSIWKKIGIGTYS